MIYPYYPERSLIIGYFALQNLQYLPRSLEAREVLFEDRTRAHADHVGHGLDRMTTGAVGILKAVRCGDQSKQNRITKVFSIPDQSLSYLKKTSR